MPRPGTGGGPASMPTTALFLTSMRVASAAAETSRAATPESVGSWPTQSAALPGARSPRAATTPSGVARSPRKSTVSTGPAHPKTSAVIAAVCRARTSGS